MSAPATPAATPDHQSGDDFGSWPTGRLLSMAARLVEGAWAERLAEQDLTHAGLMALHELGQTEPVNALDLASRCQVTPQTMTRTLDRLERDGLITRERSAADRRRVEVRRTAAGAQAYDEAADMSAAEPALLGDLVDLVDLRRHLVAIVEHLSASTAQPPGVR